jgi:hypothetical protein
VGGAVDHHDRPAALAHQAMHLRPHEQAEVRVAPGLGRQHVEQVPLRNERDVGMAQTERAEVGDVDAGAVPDQTDGVRLAVRQRQDPFGQADLGEHVESRRVDAVVASP